MLMPDPEVPGSERIKILDFGIAKLSLDALAGSESEGEGAEQGSQPEFRTRTGAMMGTPAYMAPEQCRGAEQVTDRTDVYSLGLMLYRALSGSPALVGRSDLEYLLLHTTVQPADLHEKYLIDAELSALVHAMIAKEPAQRPAMAEIAARLGKLAGRLSAPGADRAGAADASALGVAPTALGSLPDRSTGGILGNQQTAPKLAPEAPIKETTTTLASATGILPERSGGPPRRLVLAGSAAACIVAVALFGLFNQRRAAPHPPPPRPADSAAAPIGAADKTSAAPTPATAASPGGTPAARVHWEVSTHPAGALVLSAESNDVLGVTPWRHDRDAAQGPFKVLLRLPSYKDTPVTLDRSRDSVVQLMLSPAADAAPRPTRTPSRGKGVKPQTPPSGKSLTNADLPVVE